MKILLVLSIFIGIGLAGSAQTGIIAITNATVIDVKNGKLITNQTILIEGNKITSVSGKATVKETHDNNHLSNRSTS